MRHVLTKWNKIFFSALAILGFYSCSQEMNEINSGNSPVENKILQFSSQSEFDETVAKLNAMTHDELNAWAQKSALYSLYDVYEDATKEASAVQTAEDYTAFKEKYADKLYFPEVNGDCGPYLPVTNDKLSLLLNPEGEVMIEGKIANLKDITEYSQIVELGKAIPAGVGLRTSRDGDYLYVQEINYLEIRRGDYWMWIETFPVISCTEASSRLNIELNTRKRIFNGSWINAMCYTHIYSLLTFYDENDNVIQQIEVNEGQTGYSPHTYQLVWPELYGSQAVRKFKLSRNKGQLNIYYSGFFDPDKLYCITYDGGQWDNLLIDHGPYKIICP